MRSSGPFSLILLAALAGSTVAHEPTAQGPGVDIDLNNTEKVHGCWEGTNGELEGGVFYLPMDEDARAVIEAVEIANRGVPDNRVDFVIVGDGYTASEQAQFHTDATAIANNFFRYEPFISYEPYFRITQIEVVSLESGVDNDPNQGVSRNTALDMAYWCGGTERLLCVNVSKAYTAAASAPDIDQVIAIANSSKYGGAGYPSSNLGTAAGQNSAAVEIAIHEMGHSLGDLADEYTYGGPTNYSGNEPSDANVSIYDRDEQLDQQRKWWQWMDASVSGFDGPVNTYEGGNYSASGIYRASNNSMMRSLSRPFNLPSAERLIRQIYLEVDPIDDGTPNGSVLERDAMAWVQPMQPIGHDLSVTWYLNDQIILSAIGQTQLDLSTLMLLDGENTIRVDVVDPTPWVRNETIRSNFMSESRTFTVDACAPAADLTGDGEVDFFDVSAFLTAFNSQAPTADLDGDGQYTFFDVSSFLVLFSAGGC
ncbi:MAG: M64 family metallopeptidase [Phycisphaerales bacterium JB047]